METHTHWAPTSHKAPVSTRVGERVRPMWKRRGAKSILSRCFEGSRKKNIDVRCSTTRTVDDFSETKWGVKWVRGVNYPRAMGWQTDLQTPPTLQSETRYHIAFFVGSLRGEIILLSKFWKQTYICNNFTFLFYCWPAVVCLIVLKALRWILNRLWLFYLQKGDILFSWASWIQPLTKINKWNFKCLNVLL